MIGIVRSEIESRFDDVREEYDRADLDPLRLRDPAAHARGLADGIELLATIAAT